MCDSDVKSVGLPLWCVNATLLYNVYNNFVRFSLGTVKKWKVNCDGNCILKSVVGFIHIQDLHRMPRVIH